MDKIVLNAHRGFAYLALLLVAVFVFALLAAMLGYSGKINKLLRKSTLFTMIFFHVQFIAGLLMLFTSKGFQAILNSGNVMKNLMGDAYNRVTFIEHPTSMLIAAVLMTIVNKKVKTNDRLTTGIVIMSAIALLLFFYAFPFARLFNK